MLPGILGAMRGAIAGGAASGPVVTFRGYSEDGASVSIGTASADRRVIVAVHWRADGVNRTLTDISLGGDGTIHVQKSHTGGSTSVGVGLCSRLVTSGTTVTINPTFSGDINSEGFGVWTMVGEENSSPTDTGTDESQGSTGTVTVDLTVLDGGAIFAAHTLSSNAATTNVAWSGLVESYDTGGGGGSPAGFSGCDGDGLAADASHSVTANPGSTADAGNDLVAMSWR
jgi:hypothetical protein